MQFMYLRVGFGFFFFPFSRMLPTKPTPENFMNQAVNDQQLYQPVFYAKVP